MSGLVLAVLNCFDSLKSLIKDIFGFMISLSFLADTFVRYEFGIIKDERLAYLFAISTKA